MPTKIYRIKINTFWITASYTAPHYARPKNKVFEDAKYDQNSFESQQEQFQEIAETATFPLHRLRKFQ